MTERKLKKYRRTIERTYTDRFSVEARKAVKNPKTGRTEPTEVVLYEDEPCRFSHEANPVSDSRELPTATQAGKLFVKPVEEVNIPPGSQITVTYDGRTEVFAHSGISRNYATHQEILLDRWERWI